MADFPRVEGPSGPEFEKPSDEVRASYQMHFPERQKGVGNKELFKANVSQLLPQHPKSLEAYSALQARAIGEGYGSF